MTASDSTPILSYELKNAKDGSIVPVINNICLHSLHRPQKEAQTLIDSHKEKILATRNSPKILLLGLGIGHHLKRLLELLKEESIHNAEIVVVEPIEKLIDEAKTKIGIEEGSSLKIYRSRNVADLYRNKDFSFFLAHKPIVICLSGAFALNKNYYESFLSHRALQTSKEYDYLNLSREIKLALGDQDDHIQFRESLEEIRKKPKLASIDHLFLAIPSFYQQEEGQREK